MSKINDLTGRIFHRLTVISYFERTVSGKHKWTCLCTCGIYKNVTSSDLVTGNTQSCGCLNDETRGQSQATHGDTNSKEYTVWLHIKDRCYNPKSKRYSDYGGRGITVHDKWRDSYELFLSDVGRAPSKKHTLDREDNNGNYEPGNVRWVTLFVQANNKRNNKILELNGRSQTLAQWCAELGIKHVTVLWRLRNGWTVEKALSTIDHRL